MEIYGSAHKHSVSNSDIEHAIGHVVAVLEEDGKVLYLGPDRAGNFLEIVSVLRSDETEVVIHAMKMRRLYESLLIEKGVPDA